MNTTRQAKAPINADRFNAILAETTPLAAVLGIRAERIGVGVAWSRITFRQLYCGRAALIAARR